MELKLELECKFCGARIDYEVTGTFTHVKCIVEPCERCTNDAMSEAWKIVKKRQEQLAGDSDE